ncbi:MAG: nuclear transport factor 2 family protein [Vicinamibacterales bacterium]
MRLFALVPLLAVAAAVVTRAQTPPAPGSTLDVVQRFNDAINRHDAVAVAALLTDDTVFENTAPAPDGTRVVGKAAVAAYWERWFVNNPDARFDSEDVVVAGDRCTVQWIYRKTRDGKPWHLRGIDLLTVRDGKIAAKLAYVKG